MDINFECSYNFTDAYMLCPSHALFDEDLFPFGSIAHFWALAAFIKLSVSFRFLDLGQSARLLEQGISSSQGLCVSAPGDCDGDGEVGGMNGFRRETEVLGQNLHRRHFNPTCQTRERTRAAAVEYSD
jgi:hypothetical protein